MAAIMAAKGSHNNMPTKRQAVSHGEKKWVVDYGLDDLGKRQRRFFDKEKEADDDIEAYEKDLKRFGEYWLRMTPAKRLSSFHGP